MKMWKPVKRNWFPIVRCVTQRWFWVMGTRNSYTEGKLEWKQRNRIWLSP